MIVISSKVNHIGSIEGNDNLAFNAEDAIDTIKRSVEHLVNMAFPSISLYLEYRYNESYFTGKKRGVYVGGLNLKTQRLTVVIGLEKEDVITKTGAIKTAVERTLQGLEGVYIRLAKNNIVDNGDAIIVALNKVQV